MGASPQQGDPQDTAAAQDTLAAAVYISPERMWGPEHLSCLGTGWCASWLLGG